MDHQHFPKVTAAHEPGADELLRPVGLDHYNALVEPAGHLLSLPECRLSHGDRKEGLHNQTHLHVSAIFTDDSFVDAKVDIQFLLDVQCGSMRYIIIKNIYIL